MTTRLEVVNACLATMGETPLNTLEDDHSYKAAALLKLDEATLIEQKPGWWFNSEYIELLPDNVSKFIYLPTDTIAVKTVDRWSKGLFAERGNRLYNMKNNNYEWTTPMVVDLVRRIPFDDLPFHGQDVVQYGAVMRFQREFDGDATRYQQLSQDYSRARIELRQEDVRNRRPNLLATSGNIIKMGMIGGFGQRGSRIPYTPGWPR